MKRLSSDTQRHLRTCLLACSLALLLHPLMSHAEPAPAPALRDGTHDLDWDIGAWKTHQKRLLHPLTGSTTWVEYDGTDVVQKIRDGLDSAEIEADGPTGHLEIYAIRLYDPDAHQWGIYFINSAAGTAGLPVIGEFKDGRGDFYDQEQYKGRTIQIRFSVSDIKADTCHFEQAFSTDGGKTWEVNFIVDETRVK